MVYRDRVSGRHTHRVVEVIQCEGWVAQGQKVTLQFIYCISKPGNVYAYSHIEKKTNCSTLCNHLSRSDLSWSRVSM